LEGDRGADGLHGAAEGREKTIPDGVDDFSGVLLDRLASNLTEFPKEV
jgi:hypothetical protein